MSYAGYCNVLDSDRKPTQTTTTPLMCELLLDTAAVPL